MKIVKKYSKILLALPVLLFGCAKDVVDITQPGRLSADVAFETVSDLQQGLLGTYRELDNTQAIQFNAIFTDELAIGFGGGGQGLNDGSYEFRMDPSIAASASLWVNQYDAANYATRLIEAAQFVTVEDGETDQFNDIVGQAHAIRAFAHLQLFTYFAESYTDDNALGVINLDFVPSPTYQPARNTVGETVAFILQDLDVAAANIDAQSNPTFLSQDAITAMRARLALYREDYAAADAAAASLLNSVSLADQDQYRQMFLDDDNTEIIWKMERSIGDIYDGQGTTGSAFAGGWAGANFAFVDATVTGSPYFEIGRSLFNLWETGDVRIDVNLNATSTPNDADPATDVLIVSKYPGSGGRPLLNDLKIFRGSEMLFIRAEAAAAGGDLAGAANFIAELRSARLGAAQTAPTYATAQEAFDGILTERRQELSFEGHRWVDLKRLGVRAGQGVLRDANDCAINNACALAASDFRISGGLPIPQLELDANKNIQQNPNY